MSSVRVIFADAEGHWLRVEDGTIVARGDQAGAIAASDEEMRLFVAPARDVSLHALDLPDLAPAQARAAAQLALADKSLLPPAELHIACGAQTGDIPTRTIALTSRAQMQTWIEAYDPDVIVPSPLLLPQPGEGYVRATLGDEVVLRGGAVGFAEDEVLTPLITGDAPITTLDKNAIESAIIAAATNPLINLREGEFARRQQWKFDALWAKRTGWIVAALLLVTILIPLTEIARLSWSSATLEDTSASLAQAALGEAVAPEVAVAALDTRLTGLRGGGAGFVKTAAAASRAVETTANVELTAMRFNLDGTLALTVRATKADEIATVQARMRAAGLDVTSGPVNPSQSQPIVEMQVRGR
jgi:general secretion pathway protein L